MYMSISPFPARPGSPETESRRARIVAGLVVLGIAASLLAYAISPGVRHVVKRAAHSVGHVFDKDEHAARKKAPSATKQHAPARSGGAGSTGGTPAGVVLGFSASAGVRARWAPQAPSLRAR
jgi:hypothetical protein